jgi:hypothetical protein
MEGEGGGPLPGPRQLAAGDPQRVLRAIPHQVRLRGE